MPTISRSRFIKKLKRRSKKPKEEKPKKEKKEEAVRQVPTPVEMPFLHFLGKLAFKKIKPNIHIAIESAKFGANKIPMKVPRAIYKDRVKIIEIHLKTDWDREQLRLSAIEQPQRLSTGEQTRAYVLQRLVGLTSEKRALYTPTDLSFRNQDEIIKWVHKHVV